jgi:hypothetical protein
MRERRARATSMPSCRESPVSMSSLAAANQKKHARARTRKEDRTPKTRAVEDRSQKRIAGEEEGLEEVQTLHTGGCQRKPALRVLARRGAPNSASKERNCFGNMRSMEAIGIVSATPTSGPAAVKARCEIELEMAHGVIGHQFR